MATTPTGDQRSRVEGGTGTIDSANSGNATTAGTGAEVGVFREGDQLISIMLRGGEQERQSPEQLASLMIQTPGGPVPLAGGVDAGDPRGGRA